MDVSNLCMMILLLTIGAFANEQEWSVQTYLGQAHTLTCNNSARGVFINTNDKLRWMKHGHPDLITSNAHYELRAKDGINNMELYIKKVTDEMGGVYICEIYLNNDTYFGRVVKGLNVGGPKYEDLIDKYETNVITGIVAGLAVLVIVAGICLIDRFRYLTNEQKQKRRDQKEERLRRLARHKNGAVDNQAYVEADEGKSGFQNTQL